MHLARIVASVNFEQSIEAATLAVMLLRRKHNAKIK